MIGWMAYLLTVSALLALAARLAEGLLTMYGRPARFVWLVALVAPLFVSLVAPRAPAELSEQPVLPVSLTALETTTVPATVTPAIEFDPIVGRIWLGSAVLGLTLLMGWFVALARAPRRWPRRRLDDEDVHVSATAGPAVFGVLAPSIVVPGWLLDCPPETRRLALLHEREHIRARDPALLAAGAALVALVPWNPIAWWQLVRLRAAVELDCDRRVLGRGASVRAYGSMLLGIAGRGHAPFAALALVEPAVLLKRRIVAMTRKPIRWRAVRGVGLGAIAGVALFAACQTEAPTAATPTAEAEATFTATEVPVGTLTRRGITEAMLDEYVSRLSAIVAAIREQQGLEPVETANAESDSRFANLRKLEVELAQLKQKMEGEYVFKESQIEQRGDEVHVTPAGVLKRLRAESEDGARSTFQAEGGKFRLRSSSIIERKPLVYVDGVRVNETDLDDIAPDAIDRVEVMKGAAAERLFGSEAGNGVISIFLKKVAGK